MSNETLQRVAPPPAPTPTHLGQATAVEQARAVAEVQAAVVLASQRPRDLDAAEAAMRRSCAHQALAERAFYRFSRGGAMVTGPSIHLARELARCFTNLQYGIAEMRRDDAGAYSEIQAWAWDLESNTRASTVFVAPHKRDTKRGVMVLSDMRDIYESNTNQGSRRVREMIFALLPPWYAEQAKDLCADTLHTGGGKTVAERVAEAVVSFGKLGINPAQLEQRLGRERGAWTEQDVTQLGIIWRSIQRGETSAADEFAPPPVTAQEITTGADKPAADDWPQVVQPLRATDREVDDG